MMADLKCGEFKPVSWRHPKAGIAIWSAPIAPPPDGAWREVFKAEVSAEALLGNSAGINLRIEGGVIEFDSHENAAKASADVVHRVVETVNRKMEALEDERKRQNEAAQKQRGEADAELRRLKEKYKDGI